MKPTLWVVLLVAGLLTACGPSESDLRTELREIESEMLAIELATRDHMARMDQAAISAAAGSFNAGYGLTAGDYDTVGEGIDVAVEATRRYDVSAYSIEQLRTRFQKLDARKQEILDALQ